MDEERSHPVSPEPGALVAQRYLLTRCLGEGGFGVVYEAEQREPVRRLVALKVIKPGMDSKSVVARFGLERQALAMMDHPCVAKVFDGGITEDGHPYFVMELVSGLPVTDHCDRQRLSIEERLGLFIRICEAVQHAHTKGVIHRDLKPSNILIEYEDGKSTPKVIDFGVAKALNEPLTEATVFTAAGQLIGTPEYMSPEQADPGGQDVDTRSDVYSLGVILYELLAGTQPFEISHLRREGLHEIQRIIRDVDPVRPSTRLGSMTASADGPGTTTRIAEVRRTQLRALRAVLRRDLDWVVMKCLEKNRERRYETADALATDLRRFLDGDFVLAGPPGVGYRIGKFVKRHRAAVAAAVLVALSVLVGTGLMAYGLRRASVAVERERAQRTRVDRMLTLQSAMLDQLRPHRFAAEWRESLLAEVERTGAEGAAQTLENALAEVNLTDVAVRTLDETLLIDMAIVLRESTDHELDVPLLTSTGALYRDIGLFQAASGVLLEARDRAERLGAHGATIRADVAYETGVLLQRQAQFDAALSSYQAALTERKRALGAADPETIRTVNRIASVMLAMSRYDESRERCEEALDLCRTHGLMAHEVGLGATYNMGLLLRHTTERRDEALEYLTTSLEGRRTLLGEDNSETLTSMSEVATVHQLNGDLNTAESLFREALTISRSAKGEHHPDTLSLRNNLAIVLRRDDRPEEALEQLELARAGFRKLVGENHADTLAITNNTGRALMSLGRSREALGIFREVEKRAVMLFGPGDVRVFHVRLNTARLLNAVEGPEVGLAALRLVATDAAEALGPEHPLALGAREAVEEATSQ